MTTAHNYIVGSIFDCVHDGEKPAVRRMLEAYGEAKNRSSEWAGRVAAQKHPKKMGRSLTLMKDHPVLLDLKEGDMFSQTHNSALRNATYSGLATMLFSGSQNVRSQRALRQRMDAMETELALVKVQAALASTRLDIKDQGKDWKEVARAIRATEPSISNRELARRVGVSESSIRKYLSDTGR